MRFFTLAALLLAFSVTASAEDYTIKTSKIPTQKVQRFNKGYQNYQKARQRKNKLINDYSSLQQSKNGILTNK